MKHRIATLVYMALIFLTLFNCTNNSRKEANVHFRINLHESKKISIDIFHVNFSDGSHTIYLDKDDFTATADTAQYYTTEFSTKTTGTLVVNFSLSDSLCDSICLGNVPLNLRNDWGWGVTFHIDHTDPFYQCFGCSGHQAFALRETYRDTILSQDTLVYDSVYINWGGNSISNPAVY